MMLQDFENDAIQNDSNQPKTEESTEQQKKQKVLSIPQLFNLKLKALKEKFHEDGVYIHPCNKCH